MKKIIYIPPSYKINKINRFNQFVCILFDLKTIFKNLIKTKKSNKSTSSFVEQSLRAKFQILELPYFYAIFFSKILNNFYDGIFVNWKFTNFREDENLKKKLFDLCKKFEIKKVLVDTRDTSNKFDNEILDSFDLIIQREKFKKIQNSKILSTMLPCTLIDYKEIKDPIDWGNIGKSKPNEKCIFDIFFSGKKTNEERNELIKTIKSLNLNYSGGTEKKIFYEDYLEKIYNSAINVAPPGVGIFTFRHLEIFASCSFLMCPSKINEIELPIPFIDGEDFVSYKDLNDFSKKAIFYIKNPEIRNKIAMNGRKKLERYYSPSSHGKIIYDRLYKN